jgi:predicted metal-dependent phosphotriesterase family hydrolase
MNEHTTAKHLVTVLGEVQPNFDGIVDAHNHIWISKMPGVQPGSPFLDQYDPILQELKEYYAAGGRGIIDCQPVGCGRDANKLESLSKQSKVQIICCTGFHRRCYYPPDSLIWKLNLETLSDLYYQELQICLTETSKNEMPIRAGFIKVAFETSLQNTPQIQLEAATLAALKSGSAIEAHTEKGADAENIVKYFLDAGLSAQKIVLCHIDKRPELSLHRDLAKEGILLEYDTFFRPKYLPEKNLWPLLNQMIKDGFEDAVALATDMAEAQSWNLLGSGPGLIGICKQIKNRLEQEAYPKKTIEKILNRNILDRLSKP